MIYEVIPEIHYKDLASCIGHLVNHQYEEAMELIPTRIIIGHQLRNGTFVLKHHDWKYFDSSIKSIQEFIDGCKCAYDEENERIVLGDIFDMIDKKGCSTDNPLPDYVKEKVVEYDGTWFYND